MKNFTWLKWLTLALAVILTGLLIWLAVVLEGRKTPPAVEPLPTATPDQVTEEVTQPTTMPTEPSTEPEPTEPAVLLKLEQLHAENPDTAGWLCIPGTVLDYPVMYTPEEPEKYLRRDFYGKDHRGGVPFFEDACSLEPESDNLIIYGHNMKDGTMFRTLMSYTEEDFFKEHPQVQYATLNEARTYDILAVFYDRVYYQYEKVFKFYKFIDAKDEEDYDKAIAYYKKHALYDTGITAEYGDRLLTLVTCSYHETNGRFVLVARERKN